jgi:hypothetical protein
VGIEAVPEVMEHEPILCGMPVRYPGRFTALSQSGPKVVDRLSSSEVTQTPQHMGKKKQCQF